MKALVLLALVASINAVYLDWLWPDSIEKKEKETEGIITSTTRDYSGSYDTADVKKDDSISHSLLDWWRGGADEKKEKEAEGIITSTTRDYSGLYDTADVKKDDSISHSLFDWWRPDVKEAKDTLTNSKYEAGKEYVYKFESQVLTGLPAFTRSYGGIKIKADVKLDFGSSTDVTMQLTDTEVFSLNHEINNPLNLPPTKQLSIDHFTPLPSNQATLIRSKMELPIKFRYANGKVTWLEVTDQETNWSIDLKRSVMAMLQVRLQDDSWSPKLRVDYNKLNSQNSTTFDFLEPALDGSCYSRISVKPTPDAEEPNQYTVMKTRDPQNCLKVNTLYKVTRPQTIDSCRCDPNLEEKVCACQPTAEEYMQSNPAYFRAKTLSEYQVVSSDKQSLVIKKCVQSATYRFEFPDTPDQYLATYSNQTLELTQQRSDQTISTRSFSWRRVSEPWRHQILKDDEEQHMMTPKQITDTVQNQINEVERLSQQLGRSSDHITVFFGLIENLKISKKEQLERTWQANNYNTTSYKRWKVLVDALAHCNTTICDQFLMDKITAEGASFPSNESVSVFIFWAAYKVPSIPVLEKFSKTVLPALEGKPQKQLAYHQALLCLGSMVRRFIDSEEMNKRICALEHDKQMHQQNIDRCKAYGKVVVSHLNNAKHNGDKIAALKSLTNMGSMESLPQLQKMMEKTETTAVRVHAVYAVRHLCYQNRMKVLQTVTPLLMNVNEDSEIRMAAFVVYMLCDPSTASLHRVIEQEPDLDLKTFFVQMLQNELRATGPKKLERKQKARLVLSKVKAFHMSPDSGTSYLRYGLRPESSGRIRIKSQLTNQTSSYPRSMSLRHEFVIRGTSQPSIEIAYRAEELEQIVHYLSQQPASRNSRSDMSILSSFLSKRDELPGGNFNPSLTLTLLLSGQEVAFIHVDKMTVMQQLVGYMKNSEIVIPIRLFQTYLTPIQESQKLQNNGMQLVNYLAVFGIIDVDGHLRIKLPTQGQKYPRILFESEKMLKVEDGIDVCQSVRTGFSQSGLSSFVYTSHTLSEQKWSVKYSPDDRNFTVVFAQPPQDASVISKLEGGSYTFFIPIGFPITSKWVPDTAKEVLTIDPERLTFNKELELFKSIDLSCKVEGDIDMPELYAYVRDRLSLMPTILFLKKQHMQLTIRPQTTAPRNYTVSVALIPLANEIVSQLNPESSSSSQDSSSEESQSDEGWILNTFGSMLSKLTSSHEDLPFSEEIEERLDSLSLGSVRHLWQGRISSVSATVNKTMSANLTTYHANNEPSVHYILRCERPPIPKQERESAVLSALIIKALNPAINQVLSEYDIAWGTKSKPSDKTIKITEKHTPTYKDDVCFEQTVYGCKDEYGVVYPVWYNLTKVIKSKNNDVMKRILNSLRPYYMNSGDKVLVEPVHKSWLTYDEINVTKIYRTYSDLVDVAFTLDGVNYNISKVYLPFEKRMDEMINQMPAFPTALVRPAGQLVPSHHPVNPFYRKDACVIEKNKVMTFDLKQLTTPQSDCEVVLVGACNKQQQYPQPQRRLQKWWQHLQPERCSHSWCSQQHQQQRQQQQIEVTLQSNTLQHHSLGSKVLKVTLEQTSIEIEVTHGSSYSQSPISVKVNGQRKSVRGHEEIPVRQQQQLVAIVKCTDKECDIVSSKHGLNIKVDDKRVSIELQDAQSKGLCGLCLPGSQAATNPVDFQTSVRIFQQSKVSGQPQCEVLERDPEEDPYNQQNRCRTINKHKVILSTMDLKVCVTVDKLPLCSRFCENQEPDVRPTTVKCVDRKEAHRLDLIPTMEGNEMYLNDDGILPRMRHSELRIENVPIAISCQ